MLYLVAFFFPFGVFFQSGKPGMGIVNLILWLTCCGSPFAVGWALFEASQYLDEERTNKVVDAIKSTRGGSRRRRDDDDYDD